MTCEDCTVPTKMVFLVRTDCGMQKGKMCAQCGHAVSKALELKNPKIKSWKQSGEKKIALKVDEEEMERCLDKARAVGLPCGYVCDAGHTQVEPGTVTVGFIGPWDDGEIDKIAGHLKLL